MPHTGLRRSLVRPSRGVLCLHLPRFWSDVPIPTKLRSDAHCRYILKFPDGSCSAAVVSAAPTQLLHRPHDVPSSFLSWWGHPEASKLITPLSWVIRRSELL